MQVQLHHPTPIQRLILIMVENCCLQQIRSVSRRPCFAARLQSGTNPTRLAHVCSCSLFCTLCCVFRCCRAWPFCTSVGRSTGTSSRPTCSPATTARSRSGPQQPQTIIHNHRILRSGVACSERHKFAGCPIFLCVTDGYVCRAVTSAWCATSRPPSHRSATAMAPTQRLQISRFACENVDMIV